MTSKNMARTTTTAAPPTSNVPVSVCRYDGAPNRFFGKYRDPDIKEPSRWWKKIPGGPFASEIDTPDKALRAATLWYEAEMAERKLTTVESAVTTTMAWPKLCDAFIEEVSARVRGADATRDAQKKLAK